MKKNIISRIVNKFMSLKLGTKMILGYFIVIIIPTIIFSTTIYSLNNRIVANQFISQSQKALDMSSQTLDNRLSSVTSAFTSFSSNPAVISYIQNTESTTAESLYTYLKDLKNIFTYTENTNEYIKKVTLYISPNRNFYLKKYIESTDSINLPSDTMTELSNNLNGLWVWEYDFSNQSVILNFYRCLFTSSYREQIGIIKVEASFNSLFSCFDSLSDFQILPHSGNQCIIFHAGKSSIIPLSSLSSNNENQVTQESECKNLQACIQQRLKPIRYLNRTLLNLLFLLILALIFLSVIYYVFMNSFTKRILLLSNHIQSTKEVSPVPFPVSQPYQDEISILIESYNHMINQINTLVNDVYQAELQKKDAQYYALQAQIKPHFLYNVLENIRMTALFNHDEETAEMVSVLGNYMRYNLSNSTAPIPLMDELAHAKSYLKIYQYRLSGKLKMSISTFTEIDFVLCPRFTLQPFLENFFKHGAVCDRIPEIHIDILEGDPMQRPNDVVVRITDNGLGILPEKLTEIKESLRNPTYESESHVGLVNTNLRLINLGGSSNYSIDISSEYNIGTTIYIYLKH